MTRPRVIVVGLGPAGSELLSGVTISLLREASQSVLRTSVHPAAQEFPSIESFDHLYERSGDFEQLYVAIVDELISRAKKHGEVVYGVPGSPLVAERTVELLRERVDIDLIVHPALSFLDLAWERLGVDPMGEQVHFVDGSRVGERLRGPGPLLITQCYSPSILSLVKLAVDSDFQEGPLEVVILHHLGLDDEVVRRVAIDQLDHFRDVDHLTSVYVPVLRTVGSAAEDLVDLMARLRRDCPWDQRQTHDSLLRHLLEEAYEALEALEELSDAHDGEARDNAYEDVLEELGDVVFQVVFHAHLAAEEGEFDLTAVFDGVREKLTVRHPHVFGDVSLTTADDVASRWEDNKKQEKGRESVTEGIPSALPAMARYVKLRRKATAIGLEGPSTDELVTSLREVLDELATEPSSVSDDAESRRTGKDVDLIASMLASIVELAQLRGIDPESALRQRSERLKENIVDSEQKSR